MLFAPRSVISTALGWLVSAFLASSFFLLLFQRQLGSITKIKFPAPQAHTLASRRLTCPKFNPGLVIPHRAVPKGHHICQVASSL